MAADAGAPKYENILLQSPRASIRGILGKSVLRGKGLFISLLMTRCGGEQTHGFWPRNARSVDSRAESFPGMLHPSQGAVIETISKAEKNWKLQMLLKQQLLI